MSSSAEFPATGVGLALDESRFAFSPGETLSGTVGWQLEMAPTRLELRLLWYTSGKGDQDVGVVDTQELDNLQASDRRRFQFALPQAPHSFSGQLISLQWAIEAPAEPGGETARIDLVLAPEGVEKRLEKVDQPMPELPKALKPLGERMKGWAERQKGNRS